MPVINRKYNNTKPIKWSYNQSSQYYNSKGWKRLRALYINNHPLCERCLLNGRSVPATDVHHKRFFLSGKTDEERWQLLLSPNNLEALCETCHHELHNIARKHNLNYIE